MNALKAEQTTNSSSEHFIIWRLRLDIITCAQDYKVWCPEGQKSKNCQVVKFGSSIESDEL